MFVMSYRVRWQVEHVSLKRILSAHQNTTAKRDELSAR